MAPIHDTDLAEERWSKTEWRNYELWEKIELRLKRKRRLWILLTTVLFLAFSSVPIVMDRWPKWTSRWASRVLAQELNKIKLEAILDRASYRLKFTDEMGVHFVVERLPDCAAGKGEVIRTGSIIQSRFNESFSWLSPRQGQELGIPGLVREFCYSSVAGNAYVSAGEEVVGMGIIPAKDLAEKRTDRLSVLLLSGPSGEATFD